MPVNARFAPQATIPSSLIRRIEPRHKNAFDNFGHTAWPLTLSCVEIFYALALREQAW